MPLTFTKMHGLGNDYIFVDVATEHLDPERGPALARAISDRHCGVGSDGLILIAPPEPRVAADARMIMFNADGSRAEMCGNGIRCLAKYVHDHGLCRSNPLRVQTDAGVLVLELAIGADDKVALVCVDLGQPRLSPADIGLRLPGSDSVATPIEVAGTLLRMTSVSVGNPHAVVFVESLSEVPLAEWGPALAGHAIFANGANAHFAAVQSRDTVAMLTWERGSGPTQACGTGAAAVCVAGVLEQRTQRAITARLPGGALTVAWDAESDHVTLTGPAVEVFTGTWSH